MSSQELRSYLLVKSLCDAKVSLPPPTVLDEIPLGEKDLVFMDDRVLFFSAKVSPLKSTSAGFSQTPSVFPPD
jgi:hypothetical protein